MFERDGVRNDATVLTKRLTYIEVNLTSNAHSKCRQFKSSIQSWRLTVVASARGHVRFLAERFDACYGSNVDPIDTVVRMSAQVCRGLNITCNAGVHCLERMRLGSGKRGGACVASRRRLV